MRQMCEACEKHPAVRVQRQRNRRLTRAGLRNEMLRYELCETCAERIYEAARLSAETEFARIRMDARALAQQ